MNNKKYSDFYERVWDVVRQIPKGKVTTYGAIAQHIGSPSAARTVGYAMHASLNCKELIPAHRVVNRNGILIGKNWFGQDNLMQSLLENEGVFVENDKIINFKNYFWDPCKSLSKTN